MQSKLHYTHECHLMCYAVLNSTTLYKITKVRYLCIINGLKKLWLDNLVAQSAQLWLSCCELSLNSIHMFNICGLILFNDINLQMVKLIEIITFKKVKVARHQTSHRQCLRCRSFSLCSYSRCTWSSFSSNNTSSLETQT